MVGCDFTALISTIRPCAGHSARDRDADYGCVEALVAVRAGRCPRWRTRNGDNFVESDLDLSNSEPESLLHANLHLWRQDDLAPVAGGLCVPPVDAATIRLYWPAAGESCRVSLPPNV